MGKIFQLAYRGMRASIGRLILTTIAIVAGVGFVAGSFIIADSLSKTFGALFENITDTIDARVAVQDLEFGNDDLQLEDSLVADLAALPEVGTATPELEYDSSGGSFAPFAIIGEDGSKLQPTGPPIITFSWDGDTDEDLLTLVDGVPPVGIGQVALDDVQAEAAGVVVGDTVNMATPDGERQFEVASIINLPITGGAWFVLFDFESAQTLYGKEGQVDQISLSRAPGVSTEEMIEAVEAALPAHARVQDQAEVLEDESAQFETIITFIRNALLAFAGVALFVSLFIIYNTFAILVSQRLRQIGMLRAVGATRLQIRLTVMIEAVLIGLVGSIVGFGFGYVVAFLIRAGFQASGGFPETDTVIETRTIVVSVLVGLVATTVSALIPAIAAGRISPIAAMRAEAPARSSTRIRIGLGLAVTILGLVLLGLGLFVGGQRLALILAELGGGAVLTFVGVSMLSVLFAGPSVEFIGRPVVLGSALLAMGVGLPVLTFGFGDGLPDGPFALVGFALKMLVSTVAVIVGASVIFNLVKSSPNPVGPGGGAVGVAGRLARQNAARSPQRTAATATALTIGVALVATVGVVGESLKSTFAESFESGFNADLFVSTQGGTLAGDFADNLETLPGIEAVSRFRANEVKHLESDQVDDLSAFNAATGDTIIDVNFADGSLEGLVDGAVLVNTEVATERDIAVGDQITLQFPRGESEALTVAGLFHSGGLLNSTWIIDIGLYERHITTPDDFAVAARVSDGADFTSVQTQAQSLADQFGSGEVQSAQEFLGAVDDQVDTLITLINYLLGFALVVAFLGVINTIVLSVIERTREIGLLRAVGMTRDQVSSAIRWESVIVCLFGAVLGVALGIVFAVAAVAAIPDSVINTVAVPYESVLFVILTAALAGVVAALVPAYRATRLNVLDAIATTD